MSVAEFYGVRANNQDVGIEIEVEGHGLPRDLDTVYWKSELDGSLRDGVEYVLKRPIAISKVVDALVELRDLFTAYGSHLMFSHRTSIHVHVNVTNMELYALKKFIFLSYMLDTVFSKIGGREIKGNRFALRMKDAMGIYYALQDLFRNNNVPDNNQAKYSIINICPITKYGSVEFRAMHGNMDIKAIDSWCQLLVSLRNESAKFKTIEEIYNLALSSPSGLLETTIPKDVLEFFKYDGITQDVQDNISLLAGLHTLRG